MPAAIKNHRRRRRRSEVSAGFFHVSFLASAMAPYKPIVRNKTQIQGILAADRQYILDRVYSKNLITRRDYLNLKSINKGNAEDHVVELVDKLIFKGREPEFVELLQSEDIQETYPELRTVNWVDPSSLKRSAGDDPYPLSSQPPALCVIINNEYFQDGTRRTGTEKDSEYLAAVFSWLGFHVLMCKDQTKSGMAQVMKHLAALKDLTTLQQYKLEEWSDGKFTPLSALPRHGDAFVCCVLSHGDRGVVTGVDGEQLPIKDITSPFDGQHCPGLLEKPKVFFIQACQGNSLQLGVAVDDLAPDEEEDGPQVVLIPVDADFLVAMATVEKYQAVRDTKNGSWFIQSLCKQLKEGCPRGDDIMQILCRVNNEVSQNKIGNRVQMPEAKKPVVRNKTQIQGILAADPQYILDQVRSKNLITQRDYLNLKSITKGNAEDHVVGLVDTLINKGREAELVEVLQSDDVQETYPLLRTVHWVDPSSLKRSAGVTQGTGPSIMDDPYPLSSQPTGLCVIINNEYFQDAPRRTGTEKDSEYLAAVFSWLGFHVLMCKDQTKSGMAQVMKHLAALKDLTTLQQYKLEEWSDGKFTPLSALPRHGDAFVCCVLSHGNKGVVSGVDSEQLPIEDITSAFDGQHCPGLLEKPKVFFIQACQGNSLQLGVAVDDLAPDEEEDGPQVVLIPVDADFLVAMATVEKYQAVRDTENGSWFIQSLCKQLKEGCPRGDDIMQILYRVNNEVSQNKFRNRVQMPEAKKVTLRRRLVFKPHEDEAPVETAAQVEPHVEASEEAMKFITSIEPSELQRCLFSDSLVSVSEGGRELGQFSVTVDVASRGQQQQQQQQPCLRLCAVSRGTIDGTACGTRTLEQDLHEYVQLQDHKMERRSHMVQRDEKMMVDKTTAVGEEVTRQSDSHTLSALRGLLSEGSSLLLMRVMALRRSVPENMTLPSLDQESNLTHTTYRSLGVKQLAVGQETVEVFGLERVVEATGEVPTFWRCYFLADGHMASREQVGSPVTMRLLQLPPQLEKDAKNDKPPFVKRPLVWEEDMEMHSKFLDRKEELQADHASYLRRHPELRTLLSDFLQFLLLRKPDDVVHFAKEYFLPFSSR
ncbi:Ciliogenesis-associated TTC17-interacting protein [Merluccius polli]|uniref:Ciliogenesis-associated TTC17-interacting protein n=1 Tax=Merluccius polli TaxID=89951 RepID=A0AA47NRE5_MERPO|nr:Ciliogenesis-associated TTC17-interacting protein [Merluccius polli]